MRDDEVRAAAERLIRDMPTLEEGGLPSIAGDVLTVARYTLEAGQEVARLRETLQRAGAGLAATYVLLHRVKDHDGAEACMDMIDEVDAALSTPGGAESGGG